MVFKEIKDMILKKDESVLSESLLYKKIAEFMRGYPHQSFNIQDHSATFNNRKDR